MIEVRKPRREELRDAGELLGVEAIDRTGLVVTSEGAFVRIFRVAPVNPLLMSGEEREKAAGTFQRLISQLHADERTQVVVEGRPVNLSEQGERRQGKPVAPQAAPSLQSPMSVERNYNETFVARLASREKQMQQSYRPVISVHKWFARRPRGPLPLPRPRRVRR
jgi:hypothetical protein